MGRFVSQKVSSSLFAIAAALALVVVVSLTSLSAQKPGKPELTAKYKQSAEEQKRDVAECYEIAKSRTGIDPETLELSTTSEGAKTAPSAASAPNNLPEADSRASAEAAKAATNERASDNNKRQLDTFRAANEACLRARGYIVNSSKNGPQ